MKKTITFFKSLLLAMILLVGSGSVYGQYSGTGTFTKITSLTDITDGYYVIVNSGDAVAMNNSTTQVAGCLGYTEVTPSSGTITNPATSIVWKIETNGTGRTIYNEATSKYVSYTGNSNNVQVVDAVTANNQRWTFSYSSNVFSVANVELTSRILQYYSNSPRFACYTSSQQKLLLYKMVATCTAPTFSFASATVNKLTTDAAFTNAFTSNNTSTKVWSSSNTGVATVNSSTGEVTIVGAGTASIKVNQAADATYCAVVDASYALTVTAPGVAEPTNQPTSFKATTNSTSQITVTWADATGAQLPEHYLVKASTGTITAPVDGTAEADAALVKNIAQGTQQAIFTGLSASTTYHFSIWPYTNSGSSINYKTDGTIATASATTETPLGVPVATAATDVTPTGFTANWGAAAAATGYDVSVYTKSRTTASDLFISEYGEGSSSNKYIEIFNGTGKSVNLSEYVLKQSYNGAGWPTDTNSPYYLPLTGTLESNDVFVVSASDASSTILSQSDMKIIQSTTSQGGKITSFTGNDALGLFKNDVLIDVFGDPGSSSTVSVAGFSTYGQDHTIVRKSTVTSGNTDWANSSGTNKTDSEWIGYSQDTWTNIGSHSMVSSLTTTPISGLPFTVTETSKAVSGLNPATTYYYTVVAKNALETSSASNEISVTTDNHLSVSGDVNASTLPDCPTCDVTVSDGAHLTVDAAKTFNAVTVQPTAKLTVSDGVTLTAPVTIKSSSAGTATAIGAVTGSSSVEQYLPDDDRQWWYLSSPVTGATSALFGSDKVGQYNEAASSYSSPFSTATNLVAGTGYVVKRAVTTPGTYTFAGTLNNGDITLHPTRTGTTDGKRGFNLVGNPYPSYLDWDAAYADAATSNVSKAIWYRTYLSGKMVFHTYADEDGVPATVSGIIPPAQAFWIRVSADGSNGTITFKNAHRSHAGATANPLKAPKSTDRPRVRLQISNGVNTDEALIVAKSYASNGIDSYDIEKMSNDNVDVPEIYTLLNNQDMVINSFNSFVAGQEIALGMRPGKAGDFTISATQLQNIPSEMKVVLKDKFTGTETELSENALYSFNADGVVTNQRFSLLFRAPGSVTGIDNAGNQTLFVYAQPSEIVVNSEELKGSKITVYTATGQSVMQVVAAGNREVLNGNFAPGVYFVKVNNTVKKVSVK